MLGLLDYSLYRIRTCLDCWIKVCIESGHAWTVGIKFVLESGHAWTVGLKFV